MLECSGNWHVDWPVNGLLADLTPLEGMNLAALTYLGLMRHEGDRRGDGLLQGLQEPDGTYSEQHAGDRRGAGRFKDCKNLTAPLAGSQVSDAGLAHFKDCKN